MREGLCDFVGLGRIVLSYPDLPADVLAGAPLRRNAFCRTFSDCTTGPRLGLVSGCFPLDPFYAARPEAIEDSGTVRDRITCGVRCDAVAERRSQMERRDR